MALTFLLIIPLTIFLLFVAPIWLWLYYSSRKQRGNVLGQQDMQQLTQLSDDVRRMRERIKTLEAILDSEHPQWRQR